MKRLRKILLTLLLPLMLAGVTGCADDLLNPDMWGDIPEGETVVSASVQFHPFTESLADTRSAGDAIRDVENLCILVYTTGETPSFVRSFYITKSEKQYDATFTEPERNEFEDAAEKRTARVNFNIPLPYGRYHILAVANMGDLTTTYPEEVYSDMDAVRKIRLTWDEKNIGANNQMFGFFTNADVVNYEPVGTEPGESVSPNIVTVNKPGISLQAWIKRAASKVTVAYDGSGLAENVRIYIQSVQIRDIPQSCLLGMPSGVAATKGESMEALYADRLIKEGEKYVYSAADPGYVAGDINDGGAVLNSGLYLSNGPGNCLRGSDHSEDDPHSLYFYENNQGREGPVKWQDKSSSDVNNNNQVSYPGSINESHEYFKDSMRGGTFVEVKAYYHSDNAGRPGSGAITYRFMLGQDTDRDYRALRNCHYKLTLKFNGYANDIDWHIEYVEPDPSMTVRSPQYVSYLYNRTAHINVKISGDIATNESLHAIITENHWYPSDASDDVYVTAAKNHINGNMHAPAEATDGDENGFLSLYRPAYAVIGAGQGTTSNYNYDYYFGGSNPTGSPLYKRDYATGLGRHTHNGDSQDWHEVTEITDADGSQSKVFSIPLYTRARSLSESRGHTGNNIFGAHIRQAYVTVRVKMKNGETLERKVDVRQVRRIENPKAIWRDAKSTEHFDVMLRYPLSEEGDDTEALVSDGPWYAEKVSDGQVDDTWYEITALGDSYTDGTGVAGRDGTKIHFRFKPRGVNSSGIPRCGVIRIYYNNYTCVHLIFVRQGYEPLAIRDGEVAWHSFNVTAIEDAADGKRSYKEAGDPRDEGSMFRWGSSKGIPASFSRDNGWGVNIGQSKWDEYKGTSYGEWPDDKSGARLATLHDFMKLFCDQDKNLHTDIEYGYGVLYGDGATETAATMTEANRYYADQGTTTRGMRGCIVYNHDNGRQLFFPIGATGYGRRKEGFDVKESDTRGEYNATGVLRYANRFKEYPAGTELNSRPLFRDLYKQQGAIYWLKKVYIGGSGDENGNPYGYSDLDGVGSIYNQSAWDINYRTLNFKFFSMNAWAGGTDCSKSDACFIRLVSDPPNSTRSTSRKKTGKRR